MAFISCFHADLANSNVLVQVQAPESGAPPPRGGHVSVAVGTKVIVFGGANRAAAPFTDLWVLETGKPPAER